MYLFNSYLLLKKTYFFQSAKIVFLDAIMQYIF